MNQFTFVGRIGTLVSAFALSIAFVSTPSALAEETGTLRVQFKFKGEIPKQKEIVPTADKAFCGQNKLLDESLIVGEDGGIKNIMLFVYTGRGGTKLPKGLELEPTTHTLANDKCRFEPHIVVAAAGDTIKVTNPDQVGHNCNFSFFKNDAVNLQVPAGGFVDIDVEEPEPGAIPVACNIHPWMTARVLVLDHRFAGVSDENGVVEISGLPTGDIEFRANHELGSLSEVIVDGKKTEWKRARFEMEIKPGMNDMGVVEVPADAF